MPCDTVQLNELEMKGLNTDLLVSALKKDGWEDVVKTVDGVIAYGLNYMSETGELQINPNCVPRSLSMWRNDEEGLEREVKRSYIWALMDERIKKMQGWEMVFDSKTGKGRLRKKVGTGGFGSQFGKDTNKGGFTGFKWGH